MAKKVGTLIKEARTGAGLTQEELARKVTNVSASDISKAERGEKELTQAALKQIAKATGVTQKSLLDAAAGKSAAEKSAAKKTTTAAKKTTAAPKKTTTNNAKKTATASLQLTVAEKRLVEMYRKADAEHRRAAEQLLQGKRPDDDNLVGSLLDGAMDLLRKLSR